MRFLLNTACPDVEILKSKLKASGAEFQVKVCYIEMVCGEGRYLGEETEQHEMEK